jgi:hypothetical protein
LEEYASKMPDTIASWYSDTSLPRRAARAVSAMYIGETIAAAPTTRPPIIRKVTKPVRELESPAPAPDTAKRAAHTIRR